MASRGKWALVASACLAAVLTAATFAQAVEQTAKNGCMSPSPTRARSRRRPSPPRRRVRRPDRLPGLVRDRERRARRLRQRSTVEYRTRPTRLAPGTRSGHVSASRRRRPRAGPTSATRTTARASRRASSRTLPLPRSVDRQRRGRAGPHPLRHGRHHLPGLPRRGHRQLYISATPPIPVGLRERRPPRGLDARRPQRPRRPVLADPIESRRTSASRARRSTLSS